jgi:hypothetical protein
LLHGGRPALIDLDAFAEADPLLDIALILSDLAAMPLDSPLPRARAREASQAFVEEYFAHVPESWRDRFPTSYARAVLKRAATISRRQSQMPGWRDKVEALIKEAKSFLRDKIFDESAERNEYPSGARVAGRVRAVAGEEPDHGSVTR